MYYSNTSSCIFIAGNLSSQFTNKCPKNKSKLYEIYLTTTVNLDLYMHESSKYIQIVH